MQGIVGHLVTTGMGPVYDGVGHFLLSPEDLIPVVAVGLFAGLRGKGAARGVLFLAPVAWFVCAVMGLESGMAPMVNAQCFSFMVLGVMVAADWPRMRDEGVQKMAVRLIVILIGGVQGYLNGVAFREAGMGKGVLELTGIVVVMFVIITLVAAVVVSLRAHWARIVVRVAGSWIAAIGLLMLGWMLRASEFKL